MTNQQEVPIIKLLLIGDQMVGKSSIMNVFCNIPFSSTMMTTLGVDFRIKTIRLDGQKIKLHIWDTAGEERFRAITNRYYRGSAGVFIVYDVTNRKSFDNIEAWLHNIENNTSNNVYKIIIGNKSDIPIDKWNVDEDSVKNLSEKYNIDYILTSAKNNDNITEAFMMLAGGAKDVIRNKFLKDMPQSGINLDLSNDDTSHNMLLGCC